MSVKNVQHVCQVVLHESKQTDREEEEEEERKNNRGREEEARQLVESYCHLLAERSANDEGEAPPPETDSEINLNSERHMS